MYKRRCLPLCLLKIPVALSWIFQHDCEFGVKPIHSFSAYLICIYLDHRSRFQVSSKGISPRIFELKLNRWGNTFHTIKMYVCMQMCILKAWSVHFIISTCCWQHKLLVICSTIFMYGPDVRNFVSIGSNDKLFDSVENEFGKGKYFSAKRSTVLKVQRRGNVTGEQKVGN